MANIYAYFGPEISKLGIPNFPLTTTGWGETYCFMSGFDSRLPENVMKYTDRIEAVCSFTKDQGLREKGIYRSGKITAELDSNRNEYSLKLKGQGYCLKEMGALYYEIRAGNVKPNPRDSYEKDQCREDPRLVSVLLEKFKNILYKKYFWPWGFWMEVKSIVKKAESEMTA